MPQVRINERGGHQLPQTISVSDLKPGEQGILVHLELPEEIAKRLMELGFVPGHMIEPGRSGPGGEPRVYRVDGSEIAIRRETARHMFVKKTR